MEDKNNITPKLLETIERYYNGLMPTDERLAFETKLQQDASFQTEVEDIKTLLLGIETQSLKEKMEVFHADLPIQMETGVSPTKVWFLRYRNIAAAVIIIAASTSFWLFNDSSNEKLYANFFKPDPGLPTTMSTSDNYTFYDAMVNYKEGEYKKAISKWEKLEVKAPNNDTVIYFIGVAYLADNDTDSAIPYLQKSSTIIESVFLKDAYFYLGLAYLKKNNKEQAILFLKKSGSDDSKKLLEKLN